jgi:hypothetical protein
MAQLDTERYGTIRHTYDGNEVGRKELCHNWQKYKQADYKQSLLVLAQTAQILIQ